MASLLLVSADFQLAESVEQLLPFSEFRLRTVATAASGREWLSMQSFDALLVDPRTTGEDDAIDLLLLGFKHNPTMLGAFVNPNGITRQEMTVHLLGGCVFQGESAMPSLGKALESLPGRFAFGETAYYAVLVVEDLDAPRDIICAYIESLGYPTVHGVKDAEEGFSRLEAAPYDYFCVITDIQMPKVSGIELIRRIRAHSLLQQLPVIALTSTPSPENLAECLRAGATGFLAKPPKKAVLRHELEKAKRLLLNGESPRICSVEDVTALEEAMRRNKIRQDG